MIIDRIENASLYYGLGSGIEKALKYLKDTDFSKMEPGRYELSDTDYALVQNYETKPREAKEWEAHRNYIDVQFIASGTELMGYTDIEPLQITKEYNDEKDILFLSGEGGFLRAPAGTFIILYPHDAHMPGVNPDRPERVRKVVVKVRI